MKKIYLASMLFMILALAGCGSGGGNVVVVGPAPNLTSIPSSLALDGYVVENSVTLALTSVQNSASVFAGVDPATGAEYRAFLGFPLSGVGGIPLNALIDSATLDIVIRGIRPVVGSIPLRIELVSFSAPLQPNDFDRIILPPLAFTTVSIPQAAVGTSVLIDVTALMKNAQLLSPPVSNFQVRILLDFGIVSNQLIEIDDTTQFVPLLKVAYF